MTTLKELIEEIVAFRDERDWEQFHNPKDLATAISIEASELQELFLWKSKGEVEELLGDDDTRRDLARELADTLIFALLLFNETDIDPSAAVRMKLEENAAKYPADRAHGTATKYTDLNDDQAKT